MANASKVSYLRPFVLNDKTAKEALINSGNAEEFVLRDEGRHPVALRATSWIPAFAGMTANNGVLFQRMRFRSPNKYAVKPLSAFLF
jgi:hypothetical protein